MTVTFTYELTGTGWADCEFQVNGHTVTLTASYLTDALEDLVSAVVALMLGHPRAVATFTEEPGQYRWILEAQPGDTVRIRVLEYLSGWGDVPDERGRVMLDDVSPVADLGAAVLGGADAVLARYGAQGYHERWVQHEYPRQKVEHLRTLVREHGQHGAEQIGVYPQPRASDGGEQ